ncbi:hypothetical protein Syun_008853 [Stephania yunnanensis]|uniref:Bulb-type lectin domain-containing protein n=1 Tax=Stephania yunnanensis TaxID=152371 RepID=A0AAP0KFB9_9MAGN
MASTALSSLLFLSFLSISVSSALAQVPADKTFKYVNEGEFGDYIVEYDANYRIISAPNIDFSNYPFQLFLYNTTPNAYILAIRAGIPRDEDLMRWVWDANRNNPVRENATLTFGTDGNLVLANPDGRIAWQTNTANKGVTGMALLDTGNLVLHDKNGKYIWQSFDHPSDTLMVGQSLRLNGPNKLVSRTSDSDGRDGPYSVVLEPSGLNMYVTYGGQRLRYGGFSFSGGQKYVAMKFEAVPENENATAYELTLGFEEAAAPPPPKPTRHLLQSRPVSNSEGPIIKKINYNGTLSYLRMGSDGNLKVVTYYDQTSYLKWSETYSFFGDDVRECALPTKCGSFGLCQFKFSCVACPTPKGLSAWSESCAPPKLPPCKGGAAAAVDYFKIAGVEHFMSPYLADKAQKMSVNACRDKCSKDCKCAGFFYREDTSRCFTTPLLATLIKVTNTSRVGYIKYSK